MKCSVCGTLNSTAAAFCRQCGLKLGARECPKCQGALEPDAQFCSSCGTRLVSGGETTGKACQSCGFVNAPGITYCRRCNQRIL
jgi:ribosomal protein L40E